LEESEILLTAERMIRLHGGAAIEAAAARTEQMRRQADADGFHTWTRILDRIRDLSRRTGA
jgi:hypothetical protein